METVPGKEAQTLREEGNAFYKDGKLKQGMQSELNMSFVVDNNHPAIDRYSKAVNLTPKDPAPRGNLSAAYFERGN